MEQFTPQQRFIIYLCALQDYEAANSNRDIIEDRKCDSGFCRYMRNVPDVFIYGDMRFAVQLSELFEQRPNNHVNWFDNGLLAPRIICLQNAIQLLIDKYGEELWN